MNIFIGAIFYALIVGQLTANVFATYDEDWCVENGTVCAQMNDICKLFDNDCARARYNSPLWRTFIEVDASKCTDGHTVRCLPAIPIRKPRKCPTTYAPICGRDRFMCCKFADKCRMENYNAQHTLNLQETKLEACPNDCERNDVCAKCKE